MEKLNISFCYVHISDKLNDFISGTEEVIRATIILYTHLVCGMYTSDKGGSAWIQHLEKEY